VDSDVQEDSHPVLGHITKTKDLYLEISMETKTHAGHIHSHHVLIIPPLPHTQPVQQKNIAPHLAKKNVKLLPDYLGTQTQDNPEEA
jgi:hypothetical protein